MKRKPFITLIILLFSFQQTSYGQKLKTLKYSGVYSFGKDVEKEPVGNVTVYPETDSTILFYIDVCRGAPSYNLGQLYDRLTIHNGVGFFYQKEDFGDKGCIWKITIINRILTIKTLDNAYDCGFGANVVADNKFSLIKKKIPSYFIDGHNHKIYFRKTKPEDYKQ